MDLSNVGKLSHSDCLACRNAGQNWFIWPQAFTGSCKFDIYLKMLNVPESNQYHGSHRRDVRFCVDHAQALWHEWIQLIKLEVVEQEAWDQYIDRTEL